MRTVILLIDISNNIIKYRMEKTMYKIMKRIFQARQNKISSLIVHDNFIVFILFFEQAYGELYVGSSGI